MSAPPSPTHPLFSLRSQGEATPSLPAGFRKAGFRNFAGVLAVGFREVIFFGNSTVPLSVKTKTSPSWVDNTTLSPRLSLFRHTKAGNQQGPETARGIRCFDAQLGSPIRTGLVRHHEASHLLPSEMKFPKLRG